MMNNMKMMNDMDLELVAGGSVHAHGSGVSGSWDDESTVHAHGGGVSGGWEPAEIVPEPVTPPIVVEKETEVIIVVVDNTYHKPKKHKRDDFWF